MNVCVLPSRMDTNNLPIPCTSFQLTAKNPSKVKTFFRRINRKVKRFLNLKESRIGILTTYWALETFILVSLFSTNLPLNILLVSSFIYLYGSYAIYQAVNYLVHS